MERSLDCHEIGRRYLNAVMADRKKSIRASSHLKNKNLSIYFFFFETF
jgi:hypothetical protein